MSSKTDKIDKLLREGENQLIEISSLLEDILNTKTDDKELPTEEKIQLIELVLQLRLNLENCLAMVLSIDHNILYFLGIQPRNSLQMNIDRLTFAIGNEDLKEILTLLAILTGSLNKLAERYKRSHSSFTLNHKVKPHKHNLLKKITKLTEKQKDLSNTLEKTDEEIKLLVKYQAAGPLFDHIGALRGPISHFHQAILHGLGQAKRLYQVVNKKEPLNHHLHTLINKTERLLDEPLQQSRQYKFNMSSEKLEDLAQQKRQSPFFGKHK